jgi:hypothetical protein
MSSDIQEIADDVDSHIVAGVEDRETEVGEIGGAGRSTTNNRQRRGAETDRIEGKPKAKTLRAQAGAYCQSLSGILVTLIAILLVSLLFFSQSVVSFFSRKQQTRESSF